MNIKTIEEKAKAYDEALNWMRELYPGLHGATKEDAEHYFPELRESEDERIRRTLVEYFGPEAQLDFIRGVKIQKIRDWLEKQKDHFRDDTKMVEKQDYSGLNDLERVIHRGFLSAGVENVPVTIIKETANECKRIVNENAEWSEEDADILNCCISSIEEAKENRYAYKETDGDTSYDYEIAWLKSLRPVSKESLQPHWNPSKEQMDALKDVAYGTYQNGNGPALRSLYEQLKKLGVKEEPEYYQHFDPNC